jgi:glutathione S-transferase
MKLYLTPGACSLADHIALREAGIGFEPVRVDLRTKRTADGRDFLEINPKGYVPALTLDSGEILTENVAILAWVAEQHPELGLAGEFGRIRLLEALSFVATELHKPFIRSFFPTSEAEKTAARDLLARRFGHLAERWTGDHLLAAGFTVVDAYLFVMLRWASMVGLDVPEPLPDYAARIARRPAVIAALRNEELV